MSSTVQGLQRVLALAATADIRQLWLTGVFTGVIRWTEILVIGIFTFEQTESPLLVALLAFLNAVPGTLFGALVGAVGERVDRRKLLLLGYTLALVLAVVLSVLALRGVLVLWHVAAGTFLSGFIWTLEYPVRRTLLGEIAGPQSAPSALTFDIANGTAMMFLGPLLGGFLMHEFGLVAFYVLSVGSLLVAIALVSRIGFRAAPKVSRSVGFFTSMREGIGHLRHNKPVLGILVVTIILNFFGFSFVSMLPVIGAEKLGLGAVSVGILGSMEGAGALLGLLLLSVYASPAYFMRLFVGGTFVLLVMIIVFAATPWFALALVVLFIGGLGESGFGSMQAAITFIATPPQMRSRIMGLLVVCIGFGPLGILHTGLMAEWLGADVAIGIIAVEGFVAMLVCLKLLPTLREAAVNTETV